MAGTFVDYLVVDVNIKNNIGFPIFSSLRRSKNDGNTQAKRVPFLSKNDFSELVHIGFSIFHHLQQSENDENTQAKRVLFLRIPSFDNRTHNKTVF